MPSISPQSTPEQNAASAGYLTEKLRNARQALVQQYGYLGTPMVDVKKKMTWDRVGNMDCLVTEEESETANAAYKTYWEMEPNARGIPPNPAQPTELSAVVKISNDDYWLTSCGMWHGKTEFTSCLADVKPTCIGVIPENPVFSDDFANVLTNLTSLLGLGATLGVPGRKGVLLSNNRIKFRHLLFEPAEGTEDQEREGSTTDSESTDTKVIPSRFTMAEWPADNPEAQEDLDNIRHTHRVNFLPAYNVQGDLIEPQDYRKTLQGALVQIHFTLSHWFIAHKDTYTANICNMRVLAPPTTYGQRNTSLKRKYHKKDQYTPDLTLKKFKVFTQSGPSTRSADRRA
ncbi:hypothetical protein JOM56_007255 [Amanita muscaria]